MIAISADKVADESALHAAVLNSAHVLGKPARQFVRNALIGGLVGLLLGEIVHRRAPS